MEKLKPCICGSTEVYYKRWKKHGAPIRLRGKVAWRVECYDCGFRTRNCFDDDAQEYGHENSKSLAKSLWNTRKG